jgi:hypothetical protein
LNDTIIRILGTKSNTAECLGAGMMLLADYGITRDYSFTVHGYHFGFADADQSLEGDVTLLQLGPLGEFHHVPVSAAQGWTITALLLASSLVAVVWLNARRRRAA